MKGCNERIENSFSTICVKNGYLKEVYSVAYKPKTEAHNLKMKRAFFSFFFFWRRLLHKTHGSHEGCVRSSQGGIPPIWWHFVSSTSVLSHHKPFSFSSQRLPNITIRIWEKKKNDNSSISILNQSMGNRIQTYIHYFFFWPMSSRNCLVYDVLVYFSANFDSGAILCRILSRTYNSTVN